MQIEAVKKKIDEIKEHGFTTIEAIEILKLAELREINDQTHDIIYDITSYMNRIE